MLHRCYTDVTQGGEPSIRLNEWKDSLFYRLLSVHGSVGTVDGAGEFELQAEDHVILRWIKHVTPGYSPVVHPGL